MEEGGAASHVQHSAEKHHHHHHRLPPQPQQRIKRLRLQARGAATHGKQKSDRVIEQKDVEQSTDDSVWKLLLQHT